MAYALSHLHSLIRGSVGGLTYFANQFHQICLRQRTAPVQPNTPWQVGIRTAFDAAEVIWESLSEEQRQAWVDFAPSCIYPGPAGPYAVPGRQLMIGTLTLANYADVYSPQTLVVHPEAPVISGWFNISGVAADEYDGLAQGISVLVTNDSDRGCIAVIDVSIAFNLTRNRYKGPWISSRKVVIACAASTSEKVDIDCPVGTLGKAIFTRTRTFTGSAPETPGVGHALAFPVHLRHICVEPAPPVNAKAKKTKVETIKTTKKKLAKARK